MKLLEATLLFPLGDGAAEKQNFCVAEPLSSGALCCSPRGGKKPQLHLLYPSRWCTWRVCLFFSPAQWCAGQGRETTGQG